MLHREVADTADRRLAAEGGLQVGPDFTLGVYEEHHGGVALGIDGVREICPANAVNIAPPRIAMIIPDTEAGNTILTVSENGYGKRTAIEDFPSYNRGGQGVIAMQTSERNGVLIGAVEVAEQDEMMLISNLGMLVRTRAAEVSVLSRNTQGVRLVRLRDGESLVGLARIEESEDENGESASDGSTDGPNGDTTPDSGTGSDNRAQGDRDDDQDAESSTTDGQE